MARHLWLGGVAALGLCLLVPVRAGAVAAVPTEDPAAIRAAIEAAVGPHVDAAKNASVDIAVGAIDPRLRFPECPALAVTVPPVEVATISAKVTCAAPAWTLYVPVHLHAWIEAVVAATNLPPEHTLRADDLSRGRVDMFAANGGVLTDPRQAEGKILRTGLSTGAPILSPLLELPIAVHRGQSVRLTLRDPTMTITTTALALEDGRVGDNIAVQNPESRKTLRATVDSEGGVELNF